MRLPVYLIHFHAEEWCRTAVASLLESDIALDVNVVNNGGDLDIDPRARVLRPRRNRGYAGGANVALREWLRGPEEFCVVGSHDLHVEANTLRLLVEAARRAPQFGILGPVVSTNWATPAIGTESGITVHEGITGTCLLLRRRCIEEIGLFDEIFRSYAEDNELCARAVRHGWKVGRVLDAAAEGRGTSASSYRELNSRANRLLLAWRTGGLRGLEEAYRKHYRLIRGSIKGQNSMQLWPLLHSLLLGSARLVKGLVIRPPRA